MIKEKLSDMNKELLFEELKYINSVLIHNDRTIGYLVISFIASIMSIYNYYVGDNRFLLLIKDNIGVSIVISMLIVIFIGFLLFVYYYRYKNMLINEIIKKEKRRH